ncbi:MAG: hypothetical protein JWN83_693 [Chitinophagaceae bacterium]|nr:hypothetical protein [Chitinophagaceae bacterium]
MFTKRQEELLDKFADLSDQLFNLNITTTDSFTGEIGEYVACRHFKLKKSDRVTRAIDGVCELGNNYQVKAKVVSNNNFNYNIGKLDTTSFHYLVIVYFDRNYCPIKIVRIPSNKIKDGKILVTSSYLNSGIEVIGKSEIKLPTKEKKAISEFAKAYIELEENGIIRSRRIVGDIGEFYACRHLDLEISSNKTEKGIDARHKNGLTFEIKTRRVYKSGRRLSEARRLNNLDGKSADYLIVVALDRAFKCAGMWLIPMKNIRNPKSAHLGIVNHTPGGLNLISSTISWLKTGDKFISFYVKKSPFQI